MKLLLKPLLIFRKFYISLFGKSNIKHLHAIRKFEIDIVIRYFKNKKNILEIGGGTGYQAKYINKKGFNIQTIDLPNSNYLERRVYPITNYDGKTIPFEDNKFDLIFSSNVLEHIEKIDAFEKEISRVCKENGLVIHILPSSVWRVWTTVTHFLKYWTLAPVHGEKAENIIDEIKIFHRNSWINHFRKNDWFIVQVIKNDIFYTGTSFLDASLNIKVRYLLSRIIGSSCNIFILKKKNSSQNL